MKQLFTIVTGILLSQCAPLAGAQEWSLVWSDEFDGRAIDLSKWEHEVNGAGGGNNELQYYTARAANSFIESGHLVIQALEETYTGPDGTRDYTSARLRTLNRGDWTYGRLEIRARLPVGQGLWPAIWMLPTDWVYGGWAASGEIDIMEYLGHQPNKVYGTLHYGGQWPANTSSGGSYVAPSGDYSSAFHTYAMEWEPNEFRWYVDGIHYHTETSWYSSAAAYPAPFNQRFHLLLNVAVGGNWPGYPDESTVFPQRMEVDYVRVYQAPTDLGPPTSISASAPTRIQAEDYATGGEGFGYHDLSPGNTGNAYRTDDVDIEATSDTGGGFNLGWIDTGEWLVYPVDVPAAGLYTVRFRTASPGGGSLQLLRGAIDLTGPVTVPVTGGWQNWTTIARSSVWLDAGEQTLRLYVVSDELNLNWLEFVPPAPGQDTDGDAMPDDWELQHDGNPTNLVAGADHDLDGASNLDEFIADTNPTNAASRFTLTAVSALDFSAWPASTGRVYGLQVNTSGLNPAAWSDALSGLTPTGDTLSVTAPPTSAPSAAYRMDVRLPAPP